MIVVRFKGGLGNQFFQYAAGRALAARHGVPLRFDARWYENPENHRAVVRTFDLPAFKVEGQLATKAELDAFGYDGTRRIWPRIKGRALRLMRGRRVWSCDSPGWLTEFMQLKANVLLDGYFQHPAFFATVQASLRRELCLRTSPPERIGQKAAMLVSLDSVCIQVRRTDFVSNPEAARRHGVCSLDYFRAAWAYVRCRVPAAKGFVFTDDPAWAEEAFKAWPDVVVVGADFDGPAYLHRFFLMKSCRHFIIANSTWGWWAAWLGANAGSIVVLPRRWLTEADTRTLGLALPEWQVL